MQKLYYSISEVSEIIGEPPYILRYWEKEFPILNPKKNRAGNRIYCDRDIEILKTIKSLLREQKFSTNGAYEELMRIFNPKKSRKFNEMESRPANKFSQNITQKTSNKVVADVGLFEPRNIYKIKLLEIRNSLKSILDLLNNF
ncbi:MAG: MerR family transcriptional regulator [Candidatus Kapaibacteriales bacterium]